MRAPAYEFLITWQAGKECGKCFRNPAQNSPIHFWFCGNPQLISNAGGTSREGSTSLRSEVGPIDEQVRRLLREVPPYRPCRRRLARDFQFFASRMVVLNMLPSTSCARVTAATGASGCRKSPVNPARCTSLRNREWRLELRRVMQFFLSAVAELRDVRENPLRGRRYCDIR